MANPFQDRINALTLQEYQADIAMQNMLKQSKKIVPDDVNSKVYARTPQAYEAPNATDLMMTDLVNDIQIQTLLKNQVPQYRPKKIQSEVTQEMINDYQQESKKPVEINGKLYKFVPPDMDIDLEEPDSGRMIKLQPRSSFLSEIGNEIKTSLHDLSKYQQDFDDYNSLLIQNDDDYNKKRIDFNQYVKMGRLYQAKVDDAKDDMDNLNDYINTLHRIPQDYDQYELSNQAEIDRVKQINRKKLAVYEGELKSRNVGQEVAQQPDESDEDYKQRLLDIGHQSVDPDDVKLDAQLYLYRNLKDKFGEFMEPYKTEGLLNTLVQQEGYEFLQKLKDRWPAVSKKIKDNFGTLKRVDQETVVAFLTTEAFEPAKPRSEKERELPGTSTLTAIPTLSDLKNNLSKRPGELPSTSTLKAIPTSLETLRSKLASRPRQRSSSNASDISSITEPSSVEVLSPVAKRLRDRSRARSEPLSPNSQPRLSEPIKMESWGRAELVSYAQAHNIRGPRGGAPENMKADTLLKLIQSQPLTGVGISPLKTKFEIVDGEIQAGNNNPKLIRDARKLLKQMVAEKMVNLYEAKSHMNHLKKIIKI